jgi:hypothetical protein
VARGGAQLMAGPLLNRAAIGQAGERIGQREFFEQAILLGQFLMQLRDARADAEARSSSSRSKGLVM